MSSPGPTYSTSSSDGKCSVWNQFLFPVVALSFFWPYLEQGEDLIRESGIPYAIVRPCALTEEPAGADLIFDQGDNIMVKDYLWFPYIARFFHLCLVSDVYFLNFLYPVSMETNVFLIFYFVEWFYYSGESFKGRDCLYLCGCSGKSICLQQDI